MCALRHALKKTTTRTRNVHSVCWVSRTLRDWQLQKRYSRMNTIQIYIVFTNYVKYFQGVYPIDLLPTTVLNPSIIVTSLDKHYISGSYWIAACFPDYGYAEYFDAYSLPPYRLQITTYLQRHSICCTFNRQTVEFNIACLRTLLLHLRSP